MDLPNTQLAEVSLTWKIIFVRCTWLEENQRTMLRGFIADSRLLKKKPKQYWTSGNLVNI